MDFSTLQPWQEIGESGVIYETGSVYARLLELTDLRKARGKRYSLVTLLMIILLAKLSGQDKPVEIADWAKNNQGRLVELLKLKRDKMPNHNTYRRVLAYKVYREEIEQLVREHHARGKQGNHYGVDGKTVRGTRQVDELRGDHLLSVYDIQEGKVLVQMEVDSKENEIVVAPQALSGLDLTGKLISADAMHTQRAFSAQIVEAGGDYIFPVKENQPRLYQDIQQLFAPEHPKPGFGKITTDFSAATQVSKGHTCTCGASAGVAGSRSARLPPVRCSTTTSTGRDWDKFIAWSDNSIGCGLELATNKPAKSNMELSVSLVQQPRPCNFSKIVANIGASKLVCIIAAMLPCAKIQPA